MRQSVLLFKLAVRNILGAGLRTWLNVVALSFSFVAIIFLQGLYSGMNDQMERATIDAMYGGGQYWQSAYDPYNPLTLPDAHAMLPGDLASLVMHGDATPILICQGTVYPGGRFSTVLLKGIDPAQHVLAIPSHLLQPTDGAVPALIGSRMAKTVGLQKGDELTVQWRDVHGTFDARDIRIVEVMKTTVQEIDNSQIWLPLSSLQELTAMPGQATIVVVKDTSQAKAMYDGWSRKELDELLRDIHATVQSKRVSGSVLYLVLLFLALLAVFDTQVFSIFRRRREMGTLMALGLTRSSLIALFTLEGAIYSILAGLVAALYGIPLLAYVATTGWKIPGAADSIGLAIGERLFPVYTVALVAGTTLFALIATTVVSYLPARRISRLKPTDALRGRMS